MSDYDRYDGFLFVWEPGNTRIEWKLVDRHRPPEPFEPCYVMEAERAILSEEEGAGGMVYRAIVATGKAWTLDGARRAALRAMKIELESDTDGMGIELGPDVARLVIEKGAQRDPRDPTE